MEYFEVDGKEYQIYPMRLGDYQKAQHLFQKINDEYLCLNLPIPKTDKNGNVVHDRKGNPVMNTSAYDAMMTLFSMALRLPIKTVKDIVDLKNGVQILEEYQQVSGLKKKMQMAAMAQALAKSKQP